VGAYAPLNPATKPGHGFCRDTITIPAIWNKSSVFLSGFKIIVNVMLHQNSIHFMYTCQEMIYIEPENKKPGKNNLYSPQADCILSRTIYFLSNLDPTQPLRLMAVCSALPLSLMGRYRQVATDQNPPFLQTQRWALPYQNRFPSLRVGQLPG